MANQKRVTKKVETVREKAQKAAGTRPKRRVLRRTAGRATAILKVLGPLAKPFQNAFMRRVGRIVGRVLWPRFFRNSWAELRQVSWPSRRETWRLTLAVFIFALVFGALVAIVDFVLDKVFKTIILK